jgi:phage baseplate assembly protein V
MANGNPLSQKGKTISPQSEDSSARVYQGAKVVKVDPEKARVKAQIPGWGTESPWLRIGFQQAKGFKHYWIPAVGDTGTVILSQSSSKGMWMACDYNDQKPTPFENPDLYGWEHTDGSQEYYDHEGDLRLISIPNGLIRTEAKNQEHHADESIANDAGNNISQSAGNNISLEADSEINSSAERQTHSAQTEITFEAPYIQFADGAGASLTLTGGLWILKDAFGHTLVMGGGGSGPGQWEWDFKGNSLDIKDVGDFSLEGTTVTAMDHEHPDSQGPAISKGW